MTPVYVLFYGYIGDDKGFPWAVFTSKEELRKYVREHHPEMKGKNRHYKSELYWEEGETGWMRADEDGVPLCGSMTDDEEWQKTEDGDYITREQARQAGRERALRKIAMISDEKR